MKALTAVCNDPRFKGIDPFFIELMCALATLVVEDQLDSRQELQEQYIREYINKMIGNPFEQRIAIQEIMVNALHTDKAAKIIRTYAKEAIELDNFKEAECAVVEPDFHNAREIRELIMNNITGIREYFGTRETAFTTICDHLKHYTTLREGDNEARRGGTRWEHQISYAIKSKHWKECPIISTGIRGRYIIKPA